MAGPITTEISEGVATATIDAPPINLLGGELMAALDAVGRETEANADVRVLVLKSANPDFFIAHGDVATRLSGGWWLHGGWRRAGGRSLRAR